MSHMNVLMMIVNTMKMIPSHGSSGLCPSGPASGSLPVLMTSQKRPTDSTSTWQKDAIINTEKMTTPKGSKFFLPRGYLK